MDRSTFSSFLRIRSAVACVILGCACPSQGVSARPASSIRVLPEEPSRDARPVSAVPAAAPGQQARPDKAQEELYTVGVGDKLHVELYNKIDKIEFQTEVAVDDTGYISLPQIKKVKVVGLTTSQLTTILENRYREIMYDPVVIAKIAEFNSKRIHVLGNVRSAGPIKLRQNSIKLLEAIAAAGGLAEKASGMIRVIRAAGDEDLLVDLVDISDRGRVDLNVDLLPSDTIIALTNDEVVYVMGEVTHPKEYPWKPGLTLLEALATAGGFTEDAAKGRTKIIREENGKRRVIKVNPESTKTTCVLEPGDVIKVPRRIF